VRQSDAALLVVACLLVLAPTGVASAADVVLDETCSWRRYYRFGVSRFSAAALKAEGQKLLRGRRYSRLKRDTEQHLRAKGIDPRKVDWRDHAVLTLRGARAFNPSPAPPPPDDWMTAEFGDAAWVRQRTPFQGGRHPQITSPILGQYLESVDLRLQQTYYRARFLVHDQKAAGNLTLRLTYSGGVRAFLNGHEIARGHLPAGQLLPEAPGAGYPAAAYKANSARLCRRTIGPIKIPPARLRKGVNVLAIEVRASCFHPIVLTNPIQGNWGGPKRPWPHARLFKIELGPGSKAVPPAGRRPGGVQVWVEDIHHRTVSSDFLPLGEEPGTVRLVGARNGTYSAQIVVGHGVHSAPGTVPDTKPLAGLRAAPRELTKTGGAGRIPASAIRVFHLNPFPLSEWTMRRLGDERGLAASFPTMKELAGHARMAERGGVHLFEQLGAAPSVSVPAGACRPIWLSLRIPSDATPGQYRGAVDVSAGGRSLARIPVELEVVGWRLPDPKQFRTFVGLEQNPYGVARQYGTRLWSDEHFRRMDASFRQLARVGNQWLNVPVLVRTEFGNKDDSMIRWTRKKNGGWAFDYKTLDRYVDLAVKHWGRPRVIHFVVMQGMKSSMNPPTPHRVKVFDEATGKTTLFPIMDSLRQVWPPRGRAPLRADQRAAWTAFATSLCAHMQKRGLRKSMFWGAPWEGEANPALKGHLAACAPGVYWTAGPHEMMANGVYAKNERFYKIVTDIRYHGRWRSFRDDRGWKSKTLHLLNPRVGGTAMALHTTSFPFAYRVMVDRALALGRSGFSRVGADEWAGVHYDGMDMPKWLTGIPVLFMLWPGKNGAESSTRFEALLEGIQETEARIFLESSLDAGRVPRDLATRVRAVLRAHFREANFWQGNSIVHSMEQYHYRWQERSRALHRIAAEVARRQRS